MWMNIKSPEVHAMAGDWLRGGVSASQMLHVSRSAPSRSVYRAQRGSARTHYDKNG